MSLEPNKLPLWQSVTKHNLIAQSLQIKALYKTMLINTNSILTTIHQLQEKTAAQLNQPVYFLKHLKKKHNRMYGKYKQNKIKS